MADRTTVHPALLGRRHPGDIVRVVGGAVVFAAGAALAHEGDVGTGERDLFRLVNDLPKAFEVPLMVVMQAGTLGAVPVAAAACLLARRPKAVLHVGIAGVAAWTMAKVLKPAVNRGRPGDMITDVVIHGAHVSGLGFPSGHSAVAAAIAGSLAPFVPRPVRRVLWGTALTVALARMYVGAHLPLDVVGGLALGWFLASVVNLTLGTPGGVATVEGVTAAFTEAGLRPFSVRATSVDARGSSPFFAETEDGRRLIVKAIGREQRDGDVLFKLWRLIALRGIKDETPFISPKLRRFPARAGPDRRRCARLRPGRRSRR